MKRLVALLSLACAWPAPAQVEEGAAIKPQAAAMREAWRKSPTRPVAVTVPLFGRVMMFDMIRGFVPAYKAQNGRQFIFEFLPDGQTFDNWTRMVTVTAVRDVGAAPKSDLDLAAAIVGSPAGCASAPFYRALNQRKIGDGTSVVTVSKGCAGTAPNAYPGAARDIGEQSLILHFRDAQNIYSLQYAVRARFVAGQPPVPDQAVMAKLALFGAVRLCPPNPADEACQTALNLDRRRANGQ